MKFTKKYLAGEKKEVKHEKKESKAKEKAEHNPLFKKILGKKK